MEQPTQYILINYYEGGLKIGQPDPDWPEWVIVKEYEGEDQQALDKLEEQESLELLARMSEFNTQPAINIRDLCRPDGTPVVIDITPKK